MTAYDIVVQLPESRFRTFRPADQVAPNAAWVEALKIARRYDLQACCTCTRSRPPLYPRRSGNTYSVRRYPNTGRSHASDCRFYGAERGQSGQQDYQPGVIVLDNGILKVRPRLSLSKSKSGTANPNPDKQDKTTGRTKYGTASELGILHLIWEEFELNHWHPRMAGKRNWGTIANHIIRESANVRYGRLPLDEYMVVIAPGVFGTRAEWLTARAAKIIEVAGKSDRRFLILCELSDLKTENGRSRCTIKAAWSGYKLNPYIPSAQIDYWVNRFPLALAAMNEDDKRCIALLVAEPNGIKKDKPAFTVVAGGLMATNIQFIPYDSSHEFRLANLLIEKERHFSKPLRYDSDNDDALADFMLLDCTAGDEHPCEVFGMETPDYLQRKARKIAYYNQERGPDGWWYWDAAATDEIPDLPTIFRRPANP